MEHANTGPKEDLSAERQSFLTQFCRTYQLQKVVSSGPEKQTSKTK